MRCWVVEQQGKAVRQGQSAVLAEALEVRKEHFLVGGEAALCGAEIAVP